MREIEHDSLPHENAAGEVIRILDAAMAQKFGHRIGIGVFTFDFDGGHLGWASNAPREDTITMLVEFIGHQDPATLKQAVERWTALGILGPGAERAQ